MLQFYARGNLTNKKKAELRSAGRLGTAVPTWFLCWIRLLALGIFFGQLHFGGFQLLLYASHVGLVDLCGYGFVPLRECPFPVSGRQLEASCFLVEIAEMILHRGIGADPLGSFDQRVFR